jgi:osmotically inducible protein OsmC
MMAVIYTAHATATGGRDGHTETDDKKVSFDLSGPGSGGAGTNPEQLFAAGYAACFSGAAQFIAKQHGLEMGKIEVKADVNLHKDDNGFSLSAVMDVSLPDLDRTKAVALVEETHQFCPYSKATRGNMDVQLKVNGEPI